MLKYQNRIKLILLRLVLIVSMLRLVEGKARGASSMVGAVCNHSACYYYFL